MSEKIFEAQTNYGWGLTFNLTGKAPAVNKRIFPTLSDAQNYADDYNDSAIEGLLLSVINDTNEKNNGVYFVQSIKKHENDEQSVLIKVGSGDIEEVENRINEKITELLNADSNLQTALTKAIEDLHSAYQNADNEIKSIIGEVEEGKTISNVIEEIKTVVNDNKETVDNYTINNKKISESPELNSDDFSVSNNYSTINQQAINVVPGDILSTALSKIEIMLANTTLALTAAINDLEYKIGTPSEYDDEGNLLKEGTGLFKRIESIENN